MACMDIAAVDTRMDIEAADKPTKSTNVDIF
jgi:hypothetical protein